MSFLKLDRSLYQTDYAQWIEAITKKLRCQDYANVDWENLIEEIEDMGRSERRSLESSLIEHRRRIRKAIEESPSFKPYFENILAESYSEAVKQARAETGLPLETFSLECPYDETAILDDSFLPD